MRKLKERSSKLEIPNNLIREKKLTNYIFFCGFTMNQLAFVGNELTLVIPYMDNFLPIQIHG